ncbi:hypothetical protein QAD02_000455 [Eretmocerus hayati]|uniref:Uncharacterized protein n=1 Tax=Eretmocerus hayati TaxID=131215 RepID=A0ACC2NE69_9HYME|nr:hypothetical protein QAD02_000455 [Eretmocerus hayati]
MKEDLFRLTKTDKELVSKGEKLEDQHVDKFHHLIQITTSTIPRSTLYCNKLERVTPILRGTQHVQIIHCCTDGCEKCEGGHWICFFYDGESFFIYDSLNFKSLYKNAEMFLRSLCPFFDEIPIYYPQVQYQTNGKDCGPHAMAMATSVIFDEDPCTVDYSMKDLRPHILGMFHRNTLQSFPGRRSVLRQNQTNFCPKPKLTFNKLPCGLRSFPPLAIYVSTEQQSNSYFVRGLPNPDGVSCYANASLQSIVHCESMQKHCLVGAQLDQLFENMREYLSNSFVNILTLRKYADGIFSLSRQQDVSEFMTFLFDKSEYLRSNFKHTLVIRRTCLSCKLDQKTEMDNHVLIADLPADFKSGNLQTIIDHNLNKWKQTDIVCGGKLPTEKQLQLKCDDQGRCLGKRAEKLDIVSEKDMLVLSLNIMRSDSSGNITKKSDGFIYLSPIQGGTTQKFSDNHSRVGKNIFTNSSIQPTVDRLSTTSTDYPTLPDDGASRSERQSLLQNFLFPRGRPNVQIKDQSETNIDSIKVVGGPYRNVTSPCVGLVNTHVIPTKRKRDSDDVLGKRHNYTFHDSCMYEQRCREQETKITGLNSFTILTPRNSSAQNDQQKNFASYRSPLSYDTTREAGLNSLVLHPIMSELHNIGGSSNGPCIAISKKEKRKLSPGNISLLEGEIVNKMKLKKMTSITDSASMRKRSMGGKCRVPDGVIQNQSYDGIENYRIKRKRERDRASYLRCRDKILAKKKDYYQLNKMNISAKKRFAYTLNREYYKLQYKKNKEKIRISRNIRSRKAKRANNRSAKLRAAKKISKKYRKLRRRLAKYRSNFHEKDKISNKHPSEIYRVGFRKKTDTLLSDRQKIIDRVMERSDSHMTLDKLQVDRVVTRCIHIRDSHMKQLKKNLKSTQKKCELAISKLGDVPLSENVKFAISILCGRSGHRSSTEPYFLETVYNTDRFKRWLETDLDENGPEPCKTVPETMSHSRVVDENLIEPLSELPSESVDDVFIINDRGQVTNILPPIPTRGKSDGFWVCDDYCREVDVDALQDIKDLYYEVSVISYKNLAEFVSNLDVCAVQSRAMGKKGHPVTCYAEPLSCKSKFLKLDLLSYHFPYLRTMKRSIHRIKNSYQTIIDIGNALEEGSFTELNKIYEDGKNIFVTSEAKHAEICLDEDKLHDMYSAGIQKFKEIDMDPPRIPCVSCERLCTSKYTTPVVKHLDPTISECLLLGDEIPGNAELSYWKQLQSLYDPEEFNNSFICNHCSGHLKKNRLPSLCILNNLRSDKVPQEIRTLNRFEKMLIQRAKAFQCVVKLETVQKKNIPHHMKLDQVKGRTFHLPLPLEATLDKLCKDTDPIDLNHELFVLIRSNPTKKKVIWEDYVDIKKIWNALKWLKANNPLYANIHLPGTPDELLTHLAQSHLEYPEDSGDGSRSKERTSNDGSHCFAQDVNCEASRSNCCLADGGPMNNPTDFSKKTPEIAVDHPVSANNLQSDNMKPQLSPSIDRCNNNSDVKTVTDAHIKHNDNNPAIPRFASNAYKFSLEFTLGPIPEFMPIQHCIKSPSN